MSSRALSEDFLKQAFKGYDLDGDGKVTLAEFKRVMIKTGRVSPEDIEKMIGRADVDDDGHIDFKEFQKMITG